MRLLMIALAVTTAFGQSTRVFQLTQQQDSQELQQIATVLRATADIQRVSLDSAKGTVTVEGTPVQIAMADWLVHQMDLAPDTQLSGMHEYRSPAAADDVVRVFYLTHASTPQQLQEIATILRSVGDIRRLFVYSTLRAVTARGTGQQMALAAWLVDQLNQPPNVASPSPHEFKLPGDDLTRVFELTYPQNPMQVQEVVTLLRAIGDIQRIFVYNARRAVALRTTAERMALAAWLVGELDKPAAPQDRVAREYRLATGPDNLVRVFYLPASQSAEDRQKVVARVRSLAGIQRLFVYNTLGAMAARGTVSQVATAERVIEETKN